MEEKVKKPLKIMVATALWIAAAGSGTAHGQPLRDISFGLSAGSVATAPVRLAQELGLFEKQGLTARFTSMDSANNATAGIIAKSFDFALSGAGELLAAQAREVRPSNIPRM